MSDNDNKKELYNFIEKMAENQEVSSEIYFVGSLVGGTSSALALPIALYFRKVFRELNYKNFNILFFASPFQYAPATLRILNASRGKSLEDSTCGPRHKSTKSRKV